MSSTAIVAPSCAKLLMRSSQIVVTTNLTHCAISANTTNGVASRFAPHRNLGATARVTWREEREIAGLRTERKSPKFLSALATPEGVEPPTLRSEV